MNDRSMKPLGYREVQNKPPWIPSNQTERAWMRDWICSRLLDIAIAQEEQLRRSQVELKPHEQIDDNDIAKFLDDTHEWRVEVALSYGDFQTLRLMYPQIAEFIHRPKRHKVKSNWPKRPDHSRDSARQRLKRAIAEASSIRSIWKKHYGKSRRPRGDSTAEEIAAAHLGLTVGEVIKRRLSQKRLKISRQASSK